MAENYNKMSDFSMPTDLGLFTKAIVDIVINKKPDTNVRYIKPGEIYIDGRRIDISSLFRIAAQNPPQANEIAQEYVDQILDAEHAIVPYNDFAPLDQIVQHIMPRIQPESILQSLDQKNFAYVPFVNDTIIAFVHDLPTVTVTLTNAQLSHWHLDPYDVEIIARENLENYQPNFEIQIFESKEQSKCAMITCHDGYDAARLLLPSIYKKMAGYLGSNFLVGIPARDILVAMPFDCKPLINRLKSKIQQNFDTMPYPITNKLFMVTLDGIASAPLDV